MPGLSFQLHGIDGLLVYMWYQWLWYQWLWYQCMIRPVPDYSQTLQQAVKDLLAARKLKHLCNIARAGWRPCLATLFVLQWLHAACQIQL